MINYTFIIPTRNIPLLLNRCLNSIPLRNDIQIIVVDDNSDPSVVDFNNYPGNDIPNVEIHYTKEGKGAGYARNVGLNYVKGKWVIFADSDDFFSDDVESLLDDYANSDSDVIYFKVNSVNSNTLEPSNRAVGFNHYIDLFNANKIDSLELGLNYCVPWGKIIRASVIKEHQIFYSETKASNDVYFATQLSLSSRKIHVDNRCLYCITFREGSLTNTQSLNILYDRLNERLKRNQLLIDSGHKKRIGSVAYSILNIYKAAGFKETIKAINIVLKSSTPLFTGWRNWLSTISFMKANKIS